MGEALEKAGAFPGGSRYSNDENTLFVGGLPVDATDYGLYRMFSSFGGIAPRGVKAMLNEDGSCKGFGFVNFLDQGAAQMAISTLNGAQMQDGAMLQISIKKEPSTGKNGGKGKVNGQEA